jgi:magnesium-transporting ATPase (P-type)
MGKTARESDAFRKRSATIRLDMNVPLTVREFFLLKGFSRRLIRRTPALERPVFNAYRSLEVADLMGRLQSANSGLSSAEAAARLERYGPNELREEKTLSRLRVVWNQPRSPCYSRNRDDERDLTFVGFNRT